MLEITWKWSPAVGLWRVHPVLRLGRMHSCVTMAAGVFLCWWLKLIPKSPIRVHVIPLCGNTTGRLSSVNPGLVTELRLFGQKCSISFIQVAQMQIRLYMNVFFTNLFSVFVPKVHHKPDRSPFISGSTPHILRRKMQIRFLIQQRF